MCARGSAMSIRRPLVMIIDENTGIREFHAIEFAERGYEVITTGDVSAVEEMIASLQPDFVLVDPYIRGKY